MRIVIVGAGEVGYHIARRLSLEGKEVAVIDRSAEAVERISESLDVEAVCGSGSDPGTLADAGIKGADLLLAVTDSDEVNLVACLMCDSISPVTKKIVRIRNESFEPYTEFLRKNPPRIDTVINPEREVIKAVLRFLDVPGAVEVNEFAGGSLKLVGLRVDSSCRLAGTRLKDIPGITGRSSLVSAIVRNEEMIIPRGNDYLHTGDIAYFIAAGDSLDHVLKEFGIDPKPVRKVIIIGGGRSGLALARELEVRQVHAKIIEISEKRCETLARMLDKTLVIHGDGTDQRLLFEENAGEMDAFVSLTGDEETNILASLLAMKMGVKRSVTKVDKTDYLSLLPAIGIQQVVSPRLSAVDSILQYIRKGKVLSTRTLSAEQAEVIEAEALESSDIVGHPLRKVKMPKGSLVIGILHGGNMMIPSGNSVIVPGDRVLILAKREVVPRIESLLSVKLEYF